jgi:DNA-binding response OmpR family regulator
MKTAAARQQQGRVLVVEDERDVADLIRYNLTKEGYDVVVAPTGSDALKQAREVHPDLVLLDIMVPQLNGWEVCRRLKQDVATKNIPVIMVTGRVEEGDKVLGFELGADDYVTKPFSPREVVARVRAVLRRADSALDTRARAQAVLEFGTCRLDLGRRVLEIDGAPVRITRKEFDLLEMLASQPGRVFSRSQLLEEVWDFAWDGDSSTITVHVRRLREKIEPVPSDPRHILTVWGVGYRFEP